MVKNYVLYSVSYSDLLPKGAGGCLNIQFNGREVTIFITCYVFSEDGWMQSSYIYVLVAVANRTSFR